ncbi:hypothetical protein ACQY0O_002098 [Thecaphora frezii]
MAPPRPLIIDTDPGVDDVLALFLALASPEVTLAAITLTFGNTTLDYAYSNILRTGAVLRHHLSDPTTPPSVKQRFVSFSPSAPPIPIALGAQEPLGGQRFTASYFHGRDGLSGVHSLAGDPFAAPSEPPAPLIASELAACDLILDVLRNHPPGTVRIAALGPLTNLALACQKDPETFARVGAISAMGGALDVPGNTSPTAEFNFFADPWAVRYLVEEVPLLKELGGRRLPIDLLPLDVTSRHTVPYSRLVLDDEQLDKTSNRLQRFISTFLTHPRLVTNSYAAPDEFHPDKHDLFEAHDPLAVAHAVLFPIAEPGAGWRHEVRKFRIECDGTHTRGMCVVDRRGLYEHSGTNKALRHEQRQEGEGDVEREERGRNVGVVNVVKETPGRVWFEEMFLERLGL